MPLSSYLALLMDGGEWEEVAPGVASSDPLEFESVKSYSDQIAQDRKATGRLCAFAAALGRIGGRPVALGGLDYSFRGGSLGSAEGEKIARLIDTAIEKRLPVIIISVSGGARMQESTLSLMQMAKTSAKLAQLADAGLPYLSVMTSPTTGGVTASFAMLGDVNIAEPQATIGFAGNRVREETIKEELPEGFQRAEFLLEHGFIDRIVDRRHLKSELARLADLLCADPQTPA
jgi:acetyl-CoA carboxylase carboxyl transferase subunit beta